MKTIPNEKGTDGIHIFLLKRINGVFPEHKTKIGLALYANVTENNRLSAFEVHSIRIAKESRRIIDDKEIIYPERERIASTREFGSYAWTYPNLECVYAKFPMFKPYNTEIKKELSNLPIKTSQRLLNDAPETLA